MVPGDVLKVASGGYWSGHG